MICEMVAQLLRAKVSDYDSETRTLRLWDGKGKRREAREHLLPLAPIATGTVETMLAALGISKDNLPQLLSHGLSGVQSAHDDRHSYTGEKRSALTTWEQRLEEIAKGSKGGNVVPLERKAP